MRRARTAGPRAGGSTTDRWWQKSSRGGPSWVAISSFSRMVAGAWRLGNSATKAMPASSTRRLIGLGLVGVELQADGAVDGLARLAGRQDRQRPEPLGRKHHDGVDVFPLDQNVVAVDRLGMELGGRLLGPMPHRVADRPDLEPVGQCPQRGGVPQLPNISQGRSGPREVAWRKILRVKTPSLIISTHARKTQATH